MSAQLASCAAECECEKMTHLQTRLSWERATMLQLAASNAAIRMRSNSGSGRS